MLSIGEIQCSDFMKRKIVIMSLTIFVLLSLFFLYYRILKGPVLVIEDVDHHTTTVIPATNGEFTLKFIHSVHHTPVFESYVINQGKDMMLTETRFYSLGVGMPFTDEGGTFSNEKGEFVIKNFNRKFNKIPLRVSPIPEHSIIIEGKIYPLLDFGEPESLITITADYQWFLVRRPVDG